MLGEIALALQETRPHAAAVRQWWGKRSVDYSDYIEVFNTGDDEALVARFFADDIVFTGGARLYRGKDELLGFLRWAHDGVREVMRPQNVLCERDLIFVEVDMDFHATKERPDFPFGHMHPGDQVTVKFFVTYRLENDKIVELKSMTWAPERGVTKLPRLGGHPSQIAAYRAYAAAFSNGDFERFPLFYTEDVLFELNGFAPMHGRQAIVDFYRPIFAKVRETLMNAVVKADDDAIAVECVSRFTAIEDAPDFVVAPLKKCEYVDAPVFVHYQLRDGLISRIRVARAGELKAYHADGRPKAADG